MSNLFAFALEAEHDNYEIFYEGRATYKILGISDIETRLELFDLFE
jgi:hypothetical protein